MFIDYKTKMEKLDKYLGRGNLFYLKKIPLFWRENSKSIINYKSSKWLLNLWFENDVAVNFNDVKWLLTPFSNY